MQSVHVNYLKSSDLAVMKLQPTRFLNYEQLQGEIMSIETSEK